MSGNAKQGLGSTLQTCGTRQQRLRQALGNQKLDALLVSNPKDIRYLTGSPGHDCLLLILPSLAVIISDPRYDEALDPWRQAPSTEIAIGIRHRLEKTVAEVLTRQGSRRVGVQAEHLTLAWRAKLAAAVGDRTIVETTGLVAAMRMRKDATEVAAIERAIGVHQQAVEAALQQLRVGMRELEFCALLEFEMKSRGAEGPSFGTMVASGPQSSVIHYQTSMRPIQEGVLLLDWGAVVDGYCSDMTRTFGVGEMPAKVRELYSIVLEAQLAAIAAAAPGRTCAEVDAVARNIIRKAGYGDHFSHGLGHGIGLDIHEEPFFNELSTESRLEPGMVMTVEPGIYLPGAGGVRIEDDVLITDRGCRVLTSFPKGLDAAVLDVAGVGAGSGRPAGARRTSA